MRDPLEGRSPAGTIVTGADLVRVPSGFTPVIDAAVEAVADELVALYVYGSVATGQARHGHSDVDLLTVGLAPDEATAVATRLTSRFSDLCRSVDIAVAVEADFVGDTDESYGGRVFLRHYCVHLRGPNHERSTEDFPADERAARGLNGDIALHAQRWRTAIEAGDDVRSIGRRMARKTLLTVAGLVSIHDDTWTTDRDSAARRWAEIEPEHAPGLAQLVDWTRLDVSPPPAAVGETLEGTVMPIVGRFADLIGLWSESPA